MKKTVTANISGIVFHIDEDAYLKLQEYLHLLEKHFKSSDGREEILSDLENRIAEMFQEKLTTSKKVITIKDVNEVISQLGEPEQISDSDDQEQGAGAGSETGEKTAKRLFRDPDDKYIAGVSGGLGAFFNLDPTWIRIAFVLFTFFYGFGPLLYIILWIAVPKATTTAERLEMRGEKVNLSNIERSIKEELSDLKENIKEFSEETRRTFKKKSGDINQDLRQSPALGFLSKLFGAIIVVVSSVVLVTLITSLYWMPEYTLLPHHNHFYLPFMEIIRNFDPSPLMMGLGVTGILLVIGLPFLWIMILGFQLLFNFKANLRIPAIISFVLWFTGINLIIVFALNMAVFGG
jgi:phage shock protein PspC (stress-responsive transcriptional regulator)